MSLQPSRTHQDSEGSSLDYHNMNIMDIVMRLKPFKSFKLFNVPSRSLPLTLTALHLLALPVKTQWHATFYW